MNYLNTSWLGHFVKVPKGQFSMGNSSAYTSLFEKKLIERPQARKVHTVAVTQEIAVLETPVTNSMFQHYLKAQPESLNEMEFSFIANKAYFSDYYFKNKSEKSLKDKIEWQSKNLLNYINKAENSNLPVVGVDYFTCINYCHWLSSKLNCKVRLLTEAEWEYCARAGTDTIFSWGNEISPVAKHAWFFDNAKLNIKMVKQLAPNNWGLYDMTGNVWEWCADKYSQKFYDYSNKKDPKSTHGNCKRYVI